jgi:GH25 family lysozyme M1 (1,4-beta-N-acetylmuramidase)
VPIAHNLCRRTRWPVLVVALAATVNLGTAPSASADPDLSRSTRAARSAAVTARNAAVGRRNTGSPARLTITAARAAPSGVNGIDVSGWQRTVNWSYWRSNGKSFAYVKATEATSYRNPYFPAQYTGARNVGLIRGAYHFALPNRSGGSAQASYFVAHGGAWRRDGHTLPGALDIEYNPYGGTCYGMSKPHMVSWIRAFNGRYKALTHRDAVIYTTLDWWTTCTGNSTAFRYTNPLWVARYAKSVGRLPGGWPFYTFWQYGSSPLDQNHFSAKHKRLVVLANG